MLRDLLIPLLLGATLLAKDPFDYGPLEATLINKTSYEEHDGTETRLYEDLILTSTAGEIHLTTSRPNREGTFPCLFIISGLETGRKSLKLIPGHGDYVMISYEYPAVIKNIKDYRALFKLPSIRKGLFSVPTQVNAALNYLQMQHYCQSTPVSLFGFSFGSFFLGPIIEQGQAQDRTYGPSVFGYGGAGLQCVIKANVKGPSWFSSLVAYLGAKAFHPLEPALHLPHITGKFLIINGLFDSQIPNPCADCLQQLVPEPKDILLLDTEHLQPTNRALIIKLISLSRDWLSQQ